ncbi:hypothetical protein [Sphingopyxis alaskensis]|uniref:Uncharacterized protein n=1 Tax=Sphingopyxis alaskensis (strain DSM 13593 / LMG 18877 / RB2256) TaxID=317655 RepID=Q1GQ12_SPHAL|nr:hypothetical protein [Sphingopyxis alaskensis]ABF54260.1 hypothetical protein Sala_2554 [Sphingopyxis alaskensis RB2256]MCM3418028.1 hypothetical protein [Sphingopyxis alaskensis]
MHVNCMEMMMGGGGGLMMIGMGLVWLLVVLVLILAAAALVKYLRSGPRITNTRAGPPDNESGTTRSL